MDVATLYKNLENNILRRDRLGKRLRRSCRRATTEEELREVVEGVKALRTSRKALIRVLGLLRGMDSFGGFEEYLITIIEYMSLAGVHIERDVLLDVAGLLKRHRSTEQYAEEILNIDMVEIERLAEDLRATLEVIKARSGT